MQQITHKIEVVHPPQVIHTYPQQPQPQQYFPPVQATYGNNPGPIAYLPPNVEDYTAPPMDPELAPSAPPQ